MLSALFAAAEYFTRFDSDDEQEIKCLHLILRYEPEIHRVRLRYLQVLKKHTELLERELKPRSADQTDWLELARRADYLFSVLIDSDKFSRQLAGEL